LKSHFKKIYIRRVGGCPRKVQGLANEQVARLWASNGGSQSGVSPVRQAAERVGFRGDFFEYFLSALERFC